MQSAAHPNYMCTLLRCNWTVSKGGIRRQFKDELKAIKQYEGEKKQTYSMLNLMMQTYIKQTET